MSQQPNNIPPNNNHSRNSTPNMPTLPLYTNQSGNRGQPSQRGGGHRHGYPPSSHPPPSHPIPPSYAPNLGHPRAPPQARHNNNSHPPPNMSYPHPAHPAHSAHPTRQQRHSVTNSSYPTHSVSSRISHTSHVSGSHTTPHPSQTVHTAHTAHTTHQTHQSTHNHNNHNNHAATPSVAQSAATVSSIGGPPPMQHQTSAGTTMTSMSTQSTISTMSAMGYKEIVERFRDFVKSYKQKKNDADFNHGQYMKIFGRIFEKVKNIFDGVGNDNNKYPEEVLKESEKELSPLFTELICHIIPPKYTTNNNISSDHGQEEKKKEDDIDVKLEILQWIGVSKYLSIMSMESITQILEHCVKTENAVIASHVYENILIQKLFVIRAKYKSWKIKHSQLMSRQSNNPNLSMGSPGKWLFDFFMGKEHAKNKHVLKALVLIMQIVKDITKKLQHPIQWLKNIYSVKNGKKNLNAMDSHLFVATPLVHLKYLYWIIEASGDVSEYFTQRILNVPDQSKNEVRMRCMDCKSFPIFRQDCSNTNIIYNYLDAIINVYSLKDEQLIKSGIFINHNLNHNNDKNDSLNVDPITKIKINWLSLLMGGLSYTYSSFVTSYTILLPRDRNYHDALRTWEKNSITKLADATFHHLQTMRVKYNNPSYCEFLKVIATKCCHSYSFTAIMANKYFEALNKPELFIGDKHNINDKLHHYQPKLSYGSLSLNETTILKYNRKYWYCAILCSFWINGNPFSGNVHGRQVIYKDYQFYSDCNLSNVNCQIFRFDLMRKSLTILLSILRDETIPSSMQHNAAHGLTALIKFVQSFCKRYFDKNSNYTLKEFYSTFNTLKWVLEGKLVDIDQELDKLFKLLHVQQYKKYFQLQQLQQSNTNTTLNNNNSNNNNNKRKRTFSEMDNNNNDDNNNNNNKKRKLNDGSSIREEKEEESDSIDNKNMSMNIDDFYDDEDGDEELMYPDYQKTMKYEVSSGYGCVEIEHNKTIQIHGNEYKNPDWLIAEIEFLTQTVLRCIRYCRQFEQDLAGKYQGTKPRANETEFNEYKDIDLPRYSKQFATHLKLLRIYCIPKEILPHLGFKTRDEIIEQHLISFTAQLTPQQVKSIWSENIGLIIKLAEAYPNSNIYSTALKNCCQTASKIIAQYQSNPSIRNKNDHQNMAQKSFIACDAYLGYLLTNLDKLLGDDKNEKILLNEFYNDPNIENYESIQFIEEHFFDAIPPNKYSETYKDNKNGYGFIIYHDISTGKDIRIPTFNGFVLPPMIEEEKFTLYASKYLQCKHKTNNCDMVSYLDFIDINNIKNKLINNKNKSQFQSTRWVQLERHQWIIDTTDWVIRSLFKLFMQIHQLQYPGAPRSNSSSTQHASTWKGLSKLYSEAQQMITYYAKELIYKCITLSFNTSHCFIYIRLLQQIMTKCIENQFVGLLVPYTSFIIPCLVNLSNNKSLRYNVNLNFAKYETDNSSFRVLSFIPREFQHILCKSGECSLIVTTDNSLNHLPYIQQLMIPILNGLKLENCKKYPNLMNRSLNALNSWFDSLTIPSIESLLNEFGDELCRSLCKIIQKSTDSAFKTLAIRALGKLGGNNRKFLEESSSIKHEKSTLKSMTLDFKVLKGNKPNIIDISFSNIIDNALNLIIKEPTSSSSTFIGKNNTNNNYQKRLSAMKTIRALIITCVWNENDYKDKDKRAMKNLCNDLSKNRDNISNNNIPSLSIPIPTSHRLHVLQNYDFDGNIIPPPIPSGHGFNNDFFNDQNNTKSQPIFSNSEILENYKSFKTEQITKLSEEKLKTAIMCIIIACADNNLSENRQFLKSLSSHFGLLYATQPIEEIYIDDQNGDNIHNSNIYIPLQSAKYLTHHLHCDIYLDAIITVLMSQNMTWKYSANIALIQFLDIVETICKTLHKHPKLNDNKVYFIQTRKYWIIIRHVLKQLERHVINNTDAILDGVIMGLTTISFKIQNKSQILTPDLIEQFLLTAIKAARFTFIKQNDQKRHQHLKLLTNTFLETVFKTLTSIKDDNNNNISDKLKEVKSAQATFRTLGHIVTKMHLVPIGSRELMNEILIKIKIKLNCEFIDFVPILQFRTGLIKGSDINDQLGSNITGQKAPSRLAGHFDAISWGLNQNPPILKKEEINGGIYGSLHLAVKYLQSYLNKTQKIQLNINGQQQMTQLLSNSNDPITILMNKFLEYVEDYSSFIKMKTVIASMNFIISILCTPYWKNVKTNIQSHQQQHNINHNKIMDPNQIHANEKNHCFNLLIESLMNTDKEIYNTAYNGLCKLRDFGYNSSDIRLEHTPSITICIKHFNSGFERCNDPKKIGVIEALYKIFGSEIITSQTGMKGVNYFVEWFNKMNQSNSNNTLPNQYRNPYQNQSKICPDAEIPIILASFFEHIPAEDSSNSNEVSEVDPKTSKEVTPIDRMIHETVSTITNFEMKKAWPFISCYLKNSCNTINPLHVSIIPLYNKYPKKFIEKMFENIQQESKLEFYKQQFLLSILSLNQSQPIRIYFRNIQLLQNLMEKFKRLIKFPKIQNYIIRILVSIGLKDKGWFKKITTTNKDNNNNNFVLNPILEKFKSDIKLSSQNGFDNMQFNPSSLEIGKNIIKCFIYGYDKDIDASTITILSSCFSNVSLNNYQFFYKFLSKELPNKISVEKRQKLVKALLNQLFSGMPKNNDYILPLLQYGINGICSGEGILKFEKGDNNNGHKLRICGNQITIWTCNDHELSKYLLLTILKEENESESSLSILNVSEIIRIELLKLICCLMKREEPQWYRDQHIVNRFMWKIFKDKNNKFGIGSRLYACKAILILTKYYGEKQQYKSIDDNLRLLLKKSLNGCHLYFELLQSILTEYIHQQIRDHNKNKNKENRDLSKWLNNYLANFVLLLSRKSGTNSYKKIKRSGMGKYYMQMNSNNHSSKTENDGSLDSSVLVWKIYLNVFLTHKKELANYWDSIYLLYRRILKELTNDCPKSYEDHTYKISMLQSIRTCLQWIQKYPNKINDKTKLNEFFQLSWKFITKCILSPNKKLIFYTMFTGDKLNDYHFCSQLINYCSLTAKDLTKVSMECTTNLSQNLKQQTSTVWQYQYQLIVQQYQDHSSSHQKNTSVVSHCYHQYYRLITILRMMNCLLKPNKNNENIEQIIESFRKYDYDQIIELWTSVCCSVPISKQTWDSLHHQKKMFFFHTKYWYFDYDDYGSMINENQQNHHQQHHNNNNNKQSYITSRVNDKTTKIARMKMFMDCDEIYFEEMTNLNIRVAAFVKYLMKTKFKDQSNDNGIKFMNSLKDLKLHHAFYQKIMTKFEESFKQYSEQRASVNTANNNNNNDNQQQKIMYQKQLKHAKIAVVMNSQIFRFWEPIFTAKILGSKFTNNLLRYLSIFSEIIFEDYKLRIQRLAKIMSNGLRNNIPSDVGKTWENHINVFSIPLLKAITKIVCINCRKHLNEYFNRNGRQSMHHHNVHNLTTYYQHFIDIFSELFSLKFTSFNWPITIHNNLIYDIAIMVKDNLIKSNMFIRTDLKLKLIESMRSVFPKYEKLRNIYIDSVDYILDGIQNNTINDIPKPIYMINNNINDDQQPQAMNICGDDNLVSTHFVTSFLTCLTLPNYKQRYSFRDYMKRNIKKTFFDRLKLIYGGADWIEIGDKYWLTPGLDLLFDLFDNEANIDLHHPQSNITSIQAIKYYDIPSNDANKLINLTELLPFINNNNDNNMKQLILFEHEMLYKRSTFKSYEILKPLIEWMYYSPQIAQNLWLQIIQPITDKLKENDHRLLLENFHTMLLIDTDIGFEAYHLNQDEEHEGCDPMKTMMKGIALNAPSPFPDFGWNIITRCAYYHSSWFECLDIINHYLQGIFSNPAHTTKARAKQGVEPIETAEFRLVADLFDDLYKTIGANDICSSFWKERATYNGTICALNLKQFDEWDRVQHQLWKCQQKMQKKMRKVSEAEARLWQKEWLLSCKKLGHWSILEQRANDQKIPLLQLESQCQLGKWYEFNSLLQFHDEAKDDPDHCTFKSYLYQLYSALSKMIAPSGFNFDEMGQNAANNNQNNPQSHNQIHNNRHPNYQQLLQTSLKTEYVKKIISHFMPRIISRSFRKLPEFISSIHSELLHFTHFFVEIEEGIHCLEKTRQLFAHSQNMQDPIRQQYEEPVNKIRNRWRQRLPNIYEGLDIWSDIFSWRVNCFEFASYFQKNPSNSSSNNERNSLLFHDRAWTIIQLSKHGRQSNCYNSALLILSKIMSMKRMDARDFYLRIKEQVAIAKMNVNDANSSLSLTTEQSQQQDANNNNNNNNNKASSIERALHILNIANLKYFTELQKSELFSIKAEIKQKLSALDDSNASYSASLAIAGDNWKAWTKWGDFCDSIYSHKKDYRWAMYAMISYLCSLHGGDELTRAYWPDNLMNPIHPNYPKSNTNNYRHHPPFGSHNIYGNNYHRNHQHTDDVLQKHGDPEKDLEHSNYHHLVIPRILMLIQAAKLGPEDQKDDHKPNNNIKDENKKDDNSKDELKQEQPKDENAINGIPIPPHRDEKQEIKTIPTRTNSEFIRYLHDGVQKLPPHVFLGYIPQLISGLYRYENEACYLILNDHIRFIAPQYLFYYVYHYTNSNDALPLGQQAKKFRQYEQRMHAGIAQSKATLPNVIDPQQRNEINSGISARQQQANSFKRRHEQIRAVKCAIEKQKSYMWMNKLWSNLLQNSQSFKLQSIINEQKDLMPRLRKFGSDVSFGNGWKSPKLLPYLAPLKGILNDMLRHQPLFNKDNVIKANKLDFASFIIDTASKIHTISRMLKSQLSSFKQQSAQQAQINNKDKNKEIQMKKQREQVAIDGYYKQFCKDFRWIIEIDANAKKTGQQRFQQYHQQQQAQQQQQQFDVHYFVKEHLNRTSLNEQFAQRNKLFDKIFEWYKHLTFRIGIIERSLSKLKALYASDLNFYEPCQEIFCPGYIGKSLFRRKPRNDNLPHFNNISAKHNATHSSLSGHNNNNNNTIKQPPLNDDRLYGGKINRNLWSMDAPNIIRIQPKLILLPDVCKEFYMLCNDGNVRSYRIKEYKFIQKPASVMRLIRDQQLVKFCNELFKSDSQTRKRFLCNNQVSNYIPCDSSSIFYQFNANEVSFNEIVDLHCGQKYLSQTDALKTYLKQLQELKLEYEKNQNVTSITSNRNNLNININKQKIIKFETMQTEFLPRTMLEDYVAKSLIGSSYKNHSTTAEFFQFKKKFAKSLAFHNLWLNVWKTEKRNLSSYHIRMDTGELIVRGDHGTSLHSFRRHWQQYPSPTNDFPLRCTPNLKWFLTPNLLDAYFTLSLSAMATVILKSSDDDSSNNNNNNKNNNDNNNNKKQDVGRYLKHFMYIHFREAKLEEQKRRIININLNLNSSNQTNESNQKALYQLLDRYLLNQDFQWMGELNHLADTVVTRMQAMSYPVTNEPPFSFKNYNNNNNNNNIKDDNSTSDDISSIADPSEMPYLEPIQRIKAQVDTAASIEIISQMPPSWNPFF